MLVTDNDYPRFYDVPLGDGQSYVYMVATPKARPVYQWISPSHPRWYQICLSYSYLTEHDMLQDIRSGSSLRRATSVPRETSDALWRFYNSLSPNERESPC